MAADYKVTVVDSSRELSKMDKIRMKDTSDTVALDKATQDGEVIIEPVAWVELAIHNEKANDQEYNNYIVVGADGTKYRTGSDSFWRSFLDLWDELYDETGWSIKVYRLPSKNRSGKEFITCSLV